MADFKSDTQISEPTSGFSNTADMNGFGWDPDEGIFIPMQDPISYFEAPPHVTDLLRELAHGS